MYRNLTRVGSRDHTSMTLLIQSGGALVLNTVIFPS